MINDKGGIGGQPVELITGDAATPDIITGTNSSGLFYAASQVIERHGGIADGLTKRSFRNCFRVPFTASSNGQLAAAIAKA